MMDVFTVRCLLLWTFALHVVDSYPRKYPESVRNHLDARNDPKSTLMASFPSDSDQFLPEGAKVKEYIDDSFMQLAGKVFFKQSNIKFSSAKTLQYATWYPKHGNSKAEHEKTPKHIRERRSIRNSVSPSSNDPHLTTMSVNSQNDPGLESEYQNESSLERHNQNEAEAETDDHLDTDVLSPTHNTVSIYSHHQADSEHDNHQSTGSTDQHGPSTGLQNSNEHETHLNLHQHHSEPHDDVEDMTDQYFDDMDNEHLNPTALTNNDHNESNFLNDTEQTMDQENDDINNNSDHQEGNDNEEGTEQENDNIGDLNPNVHSNSEHNQNGHSGETSEDEDTQLHTGIRQQQTTSESSLPEGQHIDVPTNNADHIENDVPPDDGDGNRNSGDMSEVGGPITAAAGPDNVYTSENSITNEEDTIMRTTRNVGHAQGTGTSHTNSHENPRVNDPGTDGIPSTNTGNRNTYNVNGNPAPIENNNGDETGQLNDTSHINDNVPSVNHPTDDSKTNQTNSHLNSTAFSFTTVKSDTNRTIEINPTGSVLTNMTTSIPLHSSQQPSENSTSTSGSTSFPQSLQTPVSTSLQTQTTSFPSTNTVNRSSGTSTHTSTVSSPTTRFDNLITTNNSHTITPAILYSAANISPPTEDGPTTTVKEFSSNSPVSGGNLTAENVSSSASGLGNDTIVATVTNTRTSGGEIKTTVKLSTQTIMNTTGVTAEPAMFSDNLSSVLPNRSQTVPFISSPNPGRHNTTLISGQTPSPTRPRQTISIISSPASATSSSSPPSLPTSANTQEHIPPTMSNGSGVNGVHSTIFARRTTKLDDTTTSTTEGEPKDESTSSTQTMSTSQSTDGTSSTTVKDRPVFKPQCFMELHLSMSWSDFCTQEMSIWGELVELLQQEGGREEVTVDQVQVLNRKDDECRAVTLTSDEQIQVQVYLVNKTHHFDRNLTLVCAQLLSSKFRGGDTSLIQEKLLAVHLYDEFQKPPGNNQNSHSTSDDDNSLLNDPGVTIALVIAVVGSCCGVGLVALQTIIRRRHRNSSSSSNAHTVVSNNNRSFSITSADSIQLYTVSKSAGGVINLGLNLMEPPDPTHPLNLTQLSEFCADDHKINYEYQKLPNRLPRLSVVPNGEEDKNRYANILPLAHTRVKLNKDDSRNSHSSYINANYVTGPNNECQYYIATQAPTTKTINDFWTMVWQQEAKAIVMLTQLEEGGQCKAASYWPELTGKSAAHRHGDFVIELKQKDVNQEYISSRLEVNNLRKIETRQIQHFWYTCWPSHGTPEPISLVKFVLDTRPRFENTGKPLIVHCSPGTGRTGTFIGLDLCMRQFESKRIVDVMKTVHDLRLERAGAVQNKEQYALLYNAINEYASIVASPVVSVASSASTLHALLPD